MSCGTHKKSHILHGKGIPAQFLTDKAEPLFALFGIGSAVAQGAAETAEFFHTIQIVSVTSDTPHPGDGFAVIVDDADHQIVWDGEYLSLYTVSSHDSLDAFLAINFGKGFDEALLRDIAERQYIASAYSADLEGALEYTDDEKEAYYAEHTDAYDFIKYHMYFVGTSNEEYADMSDEEKAAAAHEAAAAIADAASGAQFAKNVYDYVSDDSKATYEDPTATLSIAQGGNLGQVYSEWLLDEARVEGDSTVIDSDGGSYALMFISRNDNHYNLVDVRHILISA